MPYTPSHLQYALSDEDIKYNDEGKELLFKRKKIAELIVSSSQICACDPLVCPETASFTQKAPTGTFPVYLSIAHIGTDQRVGFAALIFSQSPVVCWEMAVLPKQDASKLKPGDIYGYGVDSGTGCFMDSLSAAQLNSRMQGEEAYYEVITDELDKTQINTWAWANIALSINPPANLVVFSTGYGDGMYASYFGLGEDKLPVCLVTDFGLIYEKPEEATPKTNRWAFWKK
jgi:hypothetical protein